MPELTKVRLINPGPKSSASNRGAKKKKKKAKNSSKRRSAPKFMLAGGEPQNRSTMARKKKSKKKRPGKNYKKGSSLKAKKNPSMFGFGKKKKHHKKNPWLPTTTTEFTQITLGALAGGYGARAIPENLPMITKYNTGWVGYLLNLATGWGISKVARYVSGVKAEEGALVGTVLMTGGRIISDQFGRVVVQFGNLRMGYDPAFNFRRLGRYVADNLPPLPVPTNYAPSGPVPPLPVGTTPALPAAPPTAKAAMTQPTTIAAASSMGAYGRGGRYGVSRFM